MYGKPVRSTTWYYCPKCKTEIRGKIIWDEVRKEIRTGLLREDRLVPAIESQFNNVELIVKREQELKGLKDRIAFLNNKWDALYKLVSSDYPRDRFKKGEREIIEAINRAKDEQEQTERELDIIRQRRLDEEGIARFCRLVAHNMDNLSKEQWEMLLKIMRLRITVHSKDTIAVSVALPPVRESQIEFSRL